MANLSKKDTPKAMQVEAVTGHGQVTQLDRYEPTRAQPYPNQPEIPKSVEVDLDQQHNDSTIPDGLETAVEDSVERTLVDAGWRRQVAWFGPAGSQASKPSDVNGSPADRKRAQRKRDAADGWRQCTVKAPSDKDARQLLASVGLALADPTKRDAIRNAIA